MGKEDTKSMSEFAKGDIESGSIQGSYQNESNDKTPLLVHETKAIEGKPLTESNRSGDWKRLFRLALPEKWLLLFGTICLMLASATALAIPAFAGMVVDSVVPGENSADAGSCRLANLIFGTCEVELNKAMILLFIVFTLGSVFAFFRASLFTIAGERVVARMRKMLFTAVIKQEIGFYDETRTGELTNRLASDTAVLQNTVTVNVSMGLRYVAQAIGAFLLLLVISWKLTLVMLACIPVVAFGAVAYGMFVRKLSKKRQDALAKASEVAEETFSNIRTVRSFSKEQYEIDRYDERVQESYILGRNMGLAYGGFAGGIAFAAQIALGLVLWAGAAMVQNDNLTAGALTSFLMYTLTLAFALGGMSALYADFSKAIGASERVFDLMDREPRVRYEGGRRPTTVNGSITFNNVSFTYPTRPDQPVLKDLNFRISPGEVVALVGPSGGGKTTVANLIEVFYYPTAGHIFFDDHDLRDLDVEWLHSHIGIVSQNPSLFATSIRENIAYGLKNVPHEAIERAARQANAHEFIERFPEGYETPVGERGVRLSGGQKQRIAIARALLKDPKILLLDEATSNLDSESEHLVQEALDRLMAGRAVLVIAHRLSTVRNADSILVVKHGEIVERGTHSQLMALGGIYVKLVRRQLQPAAGDSFLDDVEEVEEDVAELE